MIGATHAAGVHLWQDGEVASAGVESMAETGATDGMRAESQAIVEEENGCGVVLGAGVGSGTGTASVTFQTSADFPALSLTTMIAPSPDWFVGVDGLLLQNADDTWIEEQTVDLFAYDAGSDSGATFTAVNSDTKDAISRLTEGHFAVKFGTLTITRQ